MLSNPLWLEKKISQRSTTESKARRSRKTFTRTCFVSVKSLTEVINYKFIRSSKIQSRYIFCVIANEHFAALLFAMLQAWPGKKRVDLFLRDNDTRRRSECESSLEIPNFGQVGQCCDKPNGSISIKDASVMLHKRELSTRASD